MRRGPEKGMGGLGGIGGTRSPPSPFIPLSPFKGACGATRPTCETAPASRRRRHEGGLAMELWRRLISNQRAVYLDGFVVTIEICAIAFAVAVALGLAVC